MLNPPPPAGYFAGSAWAPKRQAACESLHRAIVERREDPTGTDLHPDTPHLKAHLRRFVSNIDEAALIRLVARDYAQHGFFKPGWSARWPACGARARSEPPDIRRELDSARAPPRP